MDCILISPKQPIVSPLGEQLKEIYNIDNVDFLKKKFAYYMSPQFTDRFGDWVNESDESYAGRVNKIGEPLLQEDEYGNWYVLDKNHNKLPINNRRFQGMEQLGIKELTNFKEEVTSQIAAYIFENHINTEDFSDLESAQFDMATEVNDFFDFALSKVPDASKEKAGKTYEFLKKYNKDWVLELKDFFKAKSIEYIDAEDITDNNTQYDMEENGLGLDLRSSFEKNSKNNATSKVKLLLSFLPELDKTGKVVYGKYVVAPKLLSFNQVWYDLEKELRDVPKILKGNKVVDPLEVMKERIKNMSIRKPYMKALLYKLDKLDTNTQTQFVSAFANNTILDFDTVEVDGKEGSRKYTRLNAAETTNKSNKILSDWGITLSDNFVETVEGKDKFKLAEFKAMASENLKALKGQFNNTVKAVQQGREVGRTINESAALIAKSLKGYGIEVSPQALEYFLTGMGKDPAITPKNFINGMRDIVSAMDYMTEAIVKPNAVVVKDGVFLNPYSEIGEAKQTVITDLAKSVAYFNQELSENTLIAADKTLWKYSLSSHVNDKINTWKQDTTELEKTLGRAGSQNSVFAKLLTSKPEVLDTLKLKMTSTIQEAGKAAEGTDNTSTSEVDALNRDIFEVLGHTVYGGNPTYQTPTPADKSTAFKLSIDHFIDSGIREDNGVFRMNDRALNIFVDYFEDEMVRAASAKNDIIKATDKDGNIDTEHLIQYYHANKKGFVLEVRDRDGEVIEMTNNSNTAREIKEEFEKNGRRASIVFAGNAFKNMLAPSLSFDNIRLRHTDIPLKTFYLSTGEPVLSSNKLTDTQRSILRDKFQGMIQNAVANTVDDAFSSDILDKDGKNNNIDQNVWNKYKGNYIALFGDYVVNSMIAQVEYSKLFSGDMAMHKNIVDYFKRVPGTYISGQGLRLGVEPNDHKFKVTVLNDHIVASEYLNDMPAHIAEFYKGIDQADAQAYITPKRWKFILERLGKWSNKHDQLYDKILKGESLTKKEAKLISTQPLKGVYRSLINGRPVYLKYSQAVLLPGAVAGTPLERLAKQMEAQNIDEAVLNSGIKIGANVTEKVTPKILSGEEFKLTELDLDNRFWKLQQDLPTKQFKETLVGSQIQKNIFNKIKFDEMYDDLSGKELYTQLHDVVSQLSNMGEAEIRHMLDLGSDMTIKDWSGFTRSIVDQLKQQGMDTNIVKAVEKELSPYVLPQARTKILNTVFSMINKKTVKIKTNGGSLIQMSNFGMTKEKATEDGVYWLKNPETLAEPRLITDAAGNKKVVSGEVFISGSFLSEYIPNWRQIPADKLFGKVNPETGKREGGLVDSRVLEIVGYRIPNQGTSSNDSLQVVGILPEYYGDTIVTYTGITTKTGSDFDIDKMFVMMPAMSPKFKGDVVKHLRKTGLTDKIAKSLLDKFGYYRYGKGNIATDAVADLYNYVINNAEDVTDPALKQHMESIKEFIANQPDVKLEYIEYNEELGPMGNGKKALQNRLIELYNKVLTSPLTYNDLMTPLDFPFLKDDIEALYDLGNKQTGDLEMITPFYQIHLKYQYLAGQFGIGQVANQLVDHMRGQTADMSLKEYLGWGNFQGNKQDGRYTVFDKGLSEELPGFEAVPIDNTISAVLNAFVDIAKDPYITIANWNTLTTNMGLMLVRAGVHPFKVNGFLGQPVLKKLSSMTFSREGKLKLSGTTSATVADELMTEYLTNLKELMVANEQGAQFDLLVSDLMSESYKRVNVNGKEVPNRIVYRTVGEFRRNIKDKDHQKSMEFMVDQILTLKEYSKLSELAKDFRLTVSSSKFGETGAGINPVQLMIQRNNIGAIFQKGVIRGFSNKFVDQTAGLTSLGSYYNNTVGIVSDLIEANPKLFLTSTDNFRDLFNDIANEAHPSKSYLNDEAMGKILDESVYSAILSSFEPFNTGENKRDVYNDMFNGLYKDIESLKKMSSNFLVKELELKTDGKFKFLGINGARNKPTEYSDKLTNAWLDLMETNKELSDRLVKYAYFQSGFRNNINSIHKYIPHEYFIENNLEQYINYVSKDEQAINYGALKEQIYRHNWNNSKLVPIVKKSDIATRGNALKAREHYVILDAFSSKKTGENAFPPFVTRFVGEKGDQVLYELAGYQEVEDTFGISFEPVYIKTHKLGYKSNKGQFHEFDLNRPVTQSMHADNNLDEATRDKIIKLLDHIASQRDFIPMDGTDPRSSAFVHEAVSLPNVTRFGTQNLDKSEKSGILEEDPFKCKE